MKPYIMLNTRLRTAGDNEFEKDCFLYLNNNVSGKIVKNIRNNTDRKLATRQEKITKFVIKPKMGTHF